MPRGYSILQFDQEDTAVFHTLEEFCRWNLGGGRPNPNEAIRHIEASPAVTQPPKLEKEKHASSKNRINKSKSRKPSIIKGTDRSYKVHNRKRQYRRRAKVVPVPVPADRTRSANSSDIRS